ncbi:MAG: glycoside hydrolase family 130 protein [Bacteroidota bacterium]
MKTILPLLLALILLIGCTEESAVNPTAPIPDQNGNVFLNFEKASIPLDVATITVVMSRQGYDSLKKKIVVAEDTMAQVLFEDIPVGKWNIDVTAYGYDSLVKYFGTAETMIFDGMITNVYLTMQRVPSGVGSVIIYINWGGNPPIMKWKNWIHNTSNPVVKRNPQRPGDLGAAQSFLFTVDGTWKMTYASIHYDSSARRNVSSIGLATTNDGGNTWTKSVAPILTAGLNGWNMIGVSPGPVFKVGNTYTMLYTGADQSQRYQIGVATSSDGLQWTSSVSPLFTSLGQWDYNMHAGDVIEMNGTYYFYFSCRSSDPYSFTIGLATSTDGVNWTRFGNSPLITVSQEWEKEGVYFPSVIYEDGKFIMMYSNTSVSSSPAFGMATSTDGKQWNKLEYNPVVINNITNTDWPITEISYPSFKKINGVYRVYYTGFRWTLNYPDWSIGYATLHQ